MKSEDAAGLADAEKAVSFLPTSAGAIETRAEIYEKLGRLDEAAKDYDAALSYDPAQPDAVAGKARVAALRTAKTAPPAAQLPAPSKPPPTWSAPPPDLATPLGAAAPPQAASPSGTPSPSAPGSPRAADTAVEIAFWNSIAQSKDRADFEAYLNQFPQGAFAALARNRLKALDATGHSPANPVAPPETFGFQAL
jgi:tetratricopeptide (TPR) repeat protein